VAGCAGQAGVGGRGKLRTRAAQAAPAVRRRWRRAAGHLALAGGGASRASPASLRVLHMPQGAAGGAQRRRAGAALPLAGPAVRPQTPPSRSYRTIIYLPRKHVRKIQLHGRHGCSCSGGRSVKRLALRLCCVQVA